MNQSLDSNTTTLPWEQDYDKLKIRIYDHVLGGIFILGTVVGVLGNSSAVCYFWPRRKKTIHNMLYLTITAVDLITVSSMFPVIASLLNDRHPMLFQDEIFCEFWRSLFFATMKLSIFLAMVICFTRTMMMRYPKRSISRSGMIGAIIGYFTFWVFFDLLYVLNGWTHSLYFNKLSCCWNWADFKKFSFGMVLLLNLQAVAVFAPSLIIFICFIIGVRILLNRPVFGGENRKGFRRVSITISLFTAVFLFFNIPCTIMLIWNLLDLFGLTSSRSRTSNYYLDLCLVILPIFLNAVTNPLLYILRMKEYQNWIMLLYKNFAQRSKCSFYSSSGTSIGVESAERAIS